jgi:hypothetical protein
VPCDLQYRAGERVHTKPGAVPTVELQFGPAASDQDRLFLLTELAYGLDLSTMMSRARSTSIKIPTRGGKRMPARVKITLLLADQRGQLRPFEMITDFVLSR